MDIAITFKLVESRNIQIASSSLLSLFLVVVVVAALLIFLLVIHRPSRVVIRDTKLTSRPPCCSMGRLSDGLSFGTVRVWEALSFDGKEFFPVVVLLLLLLVAVIVDAVDGVDAVVDVSMARDGRFWDAA